MAANRLPELFTAFEKELRREISSTEEPFLGLFADKLGEKTKSLIVRFLRECVDPLQALVDNLLFFPALSSTLIVDSLLMGVGRSGHFEVYPILEDMLRSSIQTDRTRKELWQSFRKACLTLGLQVSAQTGGTHFMVKDYLRQVGLPLNYVQVFTEKSVRYANEVGLPEEGDLESLAVWQKGLLERLNTPYPKVAKKAIEYDSQNYYTGLFVTLFQNPPADKTDLSLLEQQILSSFQLNNIAKKAGKLCIPEVVIRDLQYGILLPGGIDSEEKWYIDIDGKDSHYSTHGEDLFIPLETDLAQNITIRRKGSEWMTVLWEDTKSNRFLIFSQQTGRLIQGASLADKEIYLDPGDYVVLLRFRPTDDGELEILSEDPELYVRQITLEPGSTSEVRRGPAKILLKGVEIPALTWGHKPLRGVKGNELFPSRAFSVQAHIPAEYCEKSREYTLTVRSNCLGSDVSIDFSVDEHGFYKIDLEPYLADWKPGVSRLSFTLHSQGSLKVLARKSAVIWNGLIKAERRIVFHCERLPFNIDEERCSNIKIDPARNVITFDDDTNRFFKFAFKDGSAVRNFTWAVPGIFINLLSYHDDGVDERSLPLGSILPVSKISRKNIKIFASFAGTLKLGTYEADVNFSRVGSKIIPLATLLDYSNSSHNILELQDKGTGDNISLVELVTPSTVESYTSEIREGVRHTSFRTLEKLDGIRVTAKNMVNGATHQVEFESNSGDQILGCELTPGVKSSVHFQEENEVTCYFPVKKWPEGFWVISYHLRTNGRWGMVMNTNSEEVAHSVLASPVEYAVHPKEVFDVFCRTASPEEKVELLLAVHDVMMSRFAEQCWHDIKWMKTFWLTLCSRHVRFVTDGALWGKIVRAATDWPEEAIAEGHVTTSILSGHLLNMFCFDRSFIPVTGQITNSLLSCMASFYRLGDVERALREQLIDTAVLFGFGNAALVSVSVEKPKSFSIDRYYDSLKSYVSKESTGRLSEEQWIPAKGDFLGVNHYQYALKNLEYRYRRSLPVISERRGRVLGLIKQMDGCVLSAYIDDNRFEQFSSNIDLGLFSEEEVEDESILEEEIVIKEHLAEMVHFISFLAQVCRAQVRAPGVLKHVLRDIGQRTGMSNSQVSMYIGYLLFLGEDIFAFYLMLWEVVFTAECDEPGTVTLVEETECKE